MFKLPKITLIENWKESWKFWSVRLSAFGFALLSIAEMAPGAIATVWANLPEAMQNELPDSMVKWIGIFLMVTSPIARIIKQHKLGAHNESTN